jgi:hypothetical protein
MKSENNKSDDKMKKEHEKKLNDYLMTKSEIVKVKIFSYYQGQEKVVIVEYVKMIMLTINK